MLYREAGQFKTIYADGPADLSDPPGPDRASRSLLAVAFVVVPLFATPYWFSGDPDPVPDPRAGGDRAQHPDRLRGPALARHGGVHGGRRVRRRTTSCCASRACPILLAFVAGGLCAALRRHPVRPAEPAHQGLLPRGGDARRAVLHRLGLTKVGWFSNYSSSGVITAQKIVILGYAFDTPAAKYLLMLAIVVRAGAGGEEHGAQLVGRAWMAVRDMDVAAEVIGIRLMHAKLLGVRDQLVLLRRRRRAVRLRVSRHGRARGLQPRPVVPDPVHDHHRRRRQHPGLVPRRAFIVLLPIVLSLLVDFLDSTAAPARCPRASRRTSS